MKVSVKNFGPIGEAKDIRLSPMTLFAGPSNTGKSYLAVLFYAIVETFVRDGSFPVVMQRRRAMRAVASKFSSVADGRVAPVQARLLCKEMFSFWARELAHVWREKILYCFGEEGKNLIQGKSMSVVLSSEDGAVSVDLVSPDKSRIGARARSEFADSAISAAVEVRQKLPKEDPSGKEMVMSNFFVREFRLALRSGAPGIAHYLPAIRGGIMQSHRGLVDAVMAQAPFAGLMDARARQKKSAPMFTGVLSDFIRKLIDLDGDKIQLSPYRPVFRPHRRDAKIAAIGKRMERDIMEGEIEVNPSETGYPDFRYKFSRNGAGGTLSLKNTSSMVSELAPVSIFVRHHLDESDLFILEEPEAHLHPDGQRDIADILTGLANAGVFVLATTHSDIVLEQISNAVHRANLKGKESAVKNGGVPLDAGNASAYSFAARKKGKTEVKKVEFDSTHGFLTDDHLRVSTALYNETVGLLNSANYD